MTESEREFRRTQRIGVCFGFMVWLIGSCLVIAAIIALGLPVLVAITL